MTTFYYTDKHHFDNSSVLSDAYFCTDTFNPNIPGDLVVVLHSNVKVGYQDVPRLVYDSLVNADSAGSYWNLFVKNHFDGFDTNHITHFEDIGVTESNFDNFDAWNPDDLIHNTRAEEVTSVKTKYVVALGVGEEDGEVTVFATDENDALVRVCEALKVLGWDDDYEVLSLTRYFD